MTIRLAGLADAGALARLAQRDSRAVPPGPHLVAEVAGRIDAAVSLRTREAIADPFRRTAQLVELLRFRAVNAAHAPDDGADTGAQAPARERPALAPRLAGGRP